MRHSMEWSSRPATASRSGVGSTPCASSCSWSGPRTRRRTPEHLHRVLGNHVILRCGDVYAGFAHLTTGSVAVEAGRSVLVGDVLGRVGHTGNSTAPHLHFQLMDDPDPLVAGGVPCAFRQYEVWRDGAWQRVENAIPRSTERIRSVDMADPQPGPIPSR
jgi:murein DD-endopeptidase MepM/ murein hydrolase activator NlpD